MDGEEFEINPGDPLPQRDKVYRMVVNTHRDKRNKTIPAVRCFSLSPNDRNKLSVDWDRKTTPEESIVRIGCSFKYTSNEFKPFTNREIYALKIDFLKSISEIENVIYDPIILSNPEKGEVNNPAHSLITFSLDLLNDQANEPEVYLKIRDHAKVHRVVVDMEKVTTLVENYRKNF